jgi:hypothetical protein
LLSWSPPEPVWFCLTMLDGGESGKVYSSPYEDWNFR